MANVLRATDLVALGLDEVQAARLVAQTASWPKDPVKRWQSASQAFLTPAMPFAVHRHVYNFAFAEWPESQGPRPTWQPGAHERANARIASLLQVHDVTTVAELVEVSTSAPERFWSHALVDLGIKFIHPPTRILELSKSDDALTAEHARWLPGAQLNIVESCLAAPPETPAIMWQDAANPIVTITYETLKQQTAKVAAALVSHGFRKGEAIAIDMPMIPESVALYLGIIAAGMVVVSIADSMAPAEVATRLRIANAKAIFTVLRVERGGKQLPLYEKILQANPPLAVVLRSEGASLRAGDIAWEAFLASAPSHVFAPVVAAADTTTNILFSSGTTGDPKAIPWTQLAPIKAAMDGAYHLDIQAGDVVAWPTNLGWMMGPWLIYATLINKGTMALFSDAPTTRGFGQFVQDAGVNVLGLVPSVVKTWRTDDRMVGLDWSRLKCFGSTGEASNADDYLYLMMLAGYRPVIEYCGGTEVGGGYLTGSLLQAASPATFTTPALGSRFVLLDETGQPSSNGEVFLVPPALGYSQSLLNRDHHEVYFQDTPTGPNGELLRRHGDQIEQLPGGFFRAHGRVDDTMNLGGIKVSSAEIERVLDLVPGVVRTAAVAVTPVGGGPSLLVIYAVANIDALQLKPQLQEALKTKLNPLFRIADLVLVAQMPVTASNKIMRRELRAHHPPAALPPK